MKQTDEIRGKVQRTVVIGCGAIAEKVHRASLSLLERRGYLEVVGVVDPSPDRLALGSRWFPKAQAFPDIASCFSRLKGVELTLITSPPPLHREHALVAFENGSHVLSEKPMASSVKSGREMVIGAAKHGKILAVGMPRRFYPCLLEAKRRVVAGELGGSLQFDYREGGIYRWPVATSSPFRRETSGGGVLLDKGAHAVDALVFLFGRGTVLAAADDGTACGIEANAVVDLVLERARGTLKISWDMDLNNGLYMRGDRGEIWMPIGPLDCLYTRRNSTDPWKLVSLNGDWPLDLQPTGGPRGVPAGYHECFTFQLVQMLRAILCSERPAVTGEEALIPLGLIEAAYSKAESLVKPWLSEDEQGAEVLRHWHRSA